MRNRSEILALGLELPADEREALALDLLKSIASGKVDLAAGEEGKTNEVAEAVSLYDAGYRLGEGSSKISTEASSQNFWESLQAFRASVDLEDLEVENAFGQLRDPSPGREIVL